MAQAKTRFESRLGHMVIPFLEAYIGYIPMALPKWFASDTLMRQVRYLLGKQTAEKLSPVNINI